MKLLQFSSSPDEQSLRIGLIENDEVIDLTSTPPHPTSLYDLYYLHGGQTAGLEQTVQEILSNAIEAPRMKLHKLSENTSDLSKPHLISPVTPPQGSPHLMRIWLAGVTHEDSAKLREIEAKQATGDAVNVYDQKYRECARGGIPELFSKSDPYSLVGHGGAISRPTDTLRLVPETELVSIYGCNDSGQIERLGYTGGNDYTDNGIEAENPLNLSQAKNWSHGCASLGPILVTESEFDNKSVTVSCEILRDGDRVGYKTGQTGQQHLNMPDGLFHLERSLFSRLPLEPKALQVLYWGTPLVFAESDLPNGLLNGDTVRLEFGDIGTLENCIQDFPVKEQLDWLEKNR